MSPPDPPEDTPEPATESREPAEAACPGHAAKPSGQEEAPSAAGPLGPEHAARPAAGSKDPAVVCEQIRRRFDVWLYDVLSEESPPEGLAAEILWGLQQDPAALEADAPEGGCDLYSLLSALTALTQETKLQGRAFKELTTQLPPVAELGEQVTSVLAAHKEALSAARDTAGDARALRAERDDQIARAAQSQARRELLDVLLDARDRLVRAQQAARGHLRRSRQATGSWLSRIFRRGRAAGDQRLEAVEALVKGGELVLGRLDEALERLGVREIACEGLPFDPQRMTAVDVARASGAANGTVLEVYRAGYECEGQVYRHAEVKVARAAGDMTEKQTTKTPMNTKITNLLL